MYRRNRHGFALSITKVKRVAEGCSLTRARDVYGWPRNRVQYGDIVKIGLEAGNMGSWLYSALTRLFRRIGSYRPNAIRRPGKRYLWGTRACYQHYQLRVLQFIGLDSLASLTFMPPHFAFHLYRGASDTTYFHHISSTFAPDACSSTSE